MRVIPRSVFEVKKLGFKRKPTEKDKYFVYELRKRALPKNLSGEQYEAAIREIAKELGI